MAQVSTIGPLQLPIAAGTPNQNLGDPAVDGLLDFLAWSIKNALDAKLANLLGTSADAVPIANRFAFDPTHPRGHHVRLPAPSLFVWWTGASSVQHTTLVYDYRRRTLKAMYALQELPQLGALQIRAGLLAAVDACFWDAAERKGHPDYTAPGGAQGQPFHELIAPIGAFDWRYEGGEPGRFRIDADHPQNRQALKEVAGGRDYPALHGTFTVWERIEAGTQTEYLIDASLAILANDGEGSETFKFMDRELEGPDGSDDDPP